MKKLVLMGASGALGKQAVEIIKQHSDEFQLVGVSVGKNIDYLKQLLKTFNLKYAYSLHENPDLVDLYPKTKFFFGDNGLDTLASMNDYDMLVNCLVGFVGFKPTLTAIQNHKNVAIANKETIVAGGQLIKEAARNNNVKLYPIGFGYPGIMETLSVNNKDIRRLMITGSGGTTLECSEKDLNKIGVENVIKHPLLKVGPKASVDMSTMMNEGYEIIAVHNLFNIPYEKIDVVVQKQAVIHSMVEYNDGQILAQLSNYNTSSIIKFALYYPKHIEDKTTNYLDFDVLESLDFKKIDYNKYPLIKLAKQLGSYGGNFGAILVGANDSAVQLFLEKKIKFLEIKKIVFETLKNAKFIAKPNTNQIIESYKWSKDYVMSIVKNS